MQKTVHDSVVDNIVRQFMCTVPIKHLVWGLKVPRFSLQDQKAILYGTVLSELTKKRPVQLKYQKVFLKAFLEILEKQVNCEENINKEEYCEIHEDIYPTYTDLISFQIDAKQDFFKHYFIKSSNKIISLKENVNLISEGTTGLRTWQAAIALSEWCIKNSEYLKNKSVLELGSGIGLTGITLALECSPKLICLTDCHDVVLRQLVSNVNINCGVSSELVVKKEDKFNNSEVKFQLDLCEAFFEKQQLGDTKLEIRKLPWEEIDQKTCENKTFDLILASDIVYDSDLFPPLVHALKSLWKYCQVKEIIFACTERNEKTLEEFCTVMSESFKMERLECPSIENFIAWDNSTVHLLKFTSRD